MELNDKQKNKLLRLAKVADGGEVAIIGELNALEDKVDDNYESLSEGVSEALTVALETQKMAGEPGHTPVAGVDFPLPKDGEDYVLTEADKAEIASKIDVPVVEKVIEKTEVIKEQPIVTEITEIIENPVTATQVRDKLETLKKDERLDVSAIKGLTKRLTKFGDDLLNRAIGILDQRTSFLINKVSNLQTQVNNQAHDDEALITINVTTGTTTLTNTTGHILVLCDCTGGNITVNLPTAVGNTAEFDIIKTDASLNTVTIDGFGSQTISNSLTRTIQFQNTSMDITSDNANWWIV